MKRREFCSSALAAGVAAALPTGSAVAAAEAALKEVRSEIPVITSSGGDASIERAAVNELQENLRGELLMPGNAGYDHARAVWNALIDKHPALIARCEGVADVANALTFARERDLRVSVRGGGHSISGKAVSEGGMMIDMSNMNTVRVDRAGRTARADGGCLEGHIDREAGHLGLGTTGGIVSHTGAAGLTLGGGFGRLCRHFGMACDNFIGADIVTVDGQFRHVSDSENPDLMWALRGGGSNFGIVTALEYQLHPMNTTVLAGDIEFAWKDARDALTFYAEHGNDMPDELNLNVILTSRPEVGQLVSFEVVWSGDLSKGEAAIAPLRKVAKPIADTVAAAYYPKFQMRGDNSNRHGVHMYMKSSFVNDFSPALINEVLDIHRPNPIYGIFFMQSSGAVNRVAADRTAFPHRGAHSNMMCWNLWPDAKTADERQERISQVRADWSRLVKYTHGYYVNLNDEDETRTHANYGVNYDRLVKIKNKYDPGNLMRLNANIRPTV